MAYVDLLQDNGGTKNIYPTNLVQQFSVTTASANLVDTHFLFTQGEVTAERSASFIMNRSGKISNLIVNISAAPAGVATSTFTIRKNGAAPLAGPVVVFTGPSAVTTSSDTTHSVSVVSGDLISLQWTDGGGSAAANAIASFSFL